MLRRPRGADDHGRGPVAELRGVAGRHACRPALNAGLSFASPSAGVSGRMPSSRETVFALSPAADRHRHDLGRERPGLPRRRRPLVALGGEAVLVRRG